LSLLVVVFVISVKVVVGQMTLRKHQYVAQISMVDFHVLLQRCTTFLDQELQCIIF